MSPPQAVPSVRVALPNRRYGNAGSPRSCLQSKSWRRLSIGREVEKRRVRDYVGAMNAPASPQPASAATPSRSEEHTSALQSLMRIQHAVFCLKKQIQKETKL